MQVDLMTLDDIAAMLATTRPFVRDVLVKKPEFPRPCVALSQKMRRWSRSEVEQWFVKHMKRNAR